MSVITDLAEYRNEVDITISSYYAWKNINKLAASSGEFLKALNKNALTWNITLHSLQVTFFMAIGRIFDNDNRSLTARALIKKCRNDIGEFKKSSLEARRLAENNGERPEYLSDYIAASYEATASDFDNVQSKISSYHAIYESKYKEIRHKFMAHKDYSSISLKELMFSNTSIAEAEDIIRFLDGIHEFVFQLYHNGRLINVDTHQPDLETRFTKDVNDLLTRLAASVH